MIDKLGVYKEGASINQNQPQDTSIKVLDVDQQKPDGDDNETIKMLCKEHKAPAVFYSNQQDCYYCFKCLVTSGQLLYIDQSYK